MKNKAKSAAREKADSHKTGGGEAVAGDLGGEILAALNIIAGELEQIHNTVDDDAVASQGDDARDRGQDMAQVATTSAAYLDLG